MSKRGSYDFPPKKPESEGDQESVTQLEHVPGADSETSDQGASVPVQHQSPESESTYRFFQTSQHHLSAQFESPPLNLESVASFTPAQSEPPSPFKRPSLHSTRTPSVPNPYEPPGRIPSGSWTQSFVYPPRDPSTQLPVSSQSDASAQVPLILSHRTAQSYRSSQCPLLSGSSSSSRPHQDSSFYQQSQAESSPQITTIEQLQLSGKLQPLHSQQPQLQTYEDQPTLTQSQSYQQPQLYDQLQYFSTQELVAADLRGATGTVASSPSNQTNPQPFITEQLHIFKHQSQQQTNEPFQSHQQSPYYQQPQLQDHSQYIPTQQPETADFASATAVVASSPSSQSNPQLYMTEQLELSGQHQSPHSQQLSFHQQYHFQTYEPPETHQQSQSYHQSQPYEQSQGFSTHQPVAFNSGRASDQVASSTSTTDEGRTGQVPGSYGSSQFSLPSESSSSSQTNQDYSSYLQSGLQSHPQFSPSDGLQLYQQSQPATYDQFQQYQQPQSYQQLQSYGQSQSSPTLQSVAPDLAAAPFFSTTMQGNVATSSKPQQTSMVICEIDECSNFFETENQFLHHVANKHRDEQCTKCYFHSTSKQRLKDHMIQDHPNSSDAIQKVAFPPYSPEPNPQDPVSNTGPSPSQLNPSSGQGKPTNTRTNQCSECGEQKGSIHLLIIHEKMHLNYKCPTCTTFYEKPEALDFHNRSIFHTSGGNFSIYCKHCNDEFKTLREFKRHCESRMISRKGPFTCPICGKTKRKHPLMAKHYAARGDLHYDEYAASLVTR